MIAQEQLETVVCAIPRAVAQASDKTGVGVVAIEFAREVDPEISGRTLLGATVWINDSSRPSAIRLWRAIFRELRNLLDAPAIERWQRTVSIGVDVR